jgi:Fe-Mn family superoxide dismutase
MVFAPSSRTFNRGGTMKYVLPPLPFAYDALEPYIDRATMKVHHEGHHASYVKKLN